MSISELIDQIILQSVSPRTLLNANVLARLRDYEENQSNDPLEDEQVWTFLFTYGFAIAGVAGLQHLFGTLIEQKNVGEPTQAWLEMLPMPPRQGVSGKSESNSEIDLLIGDIGSRGQTISGVEYREPHDREGIVCFVEAKWLSDISCSTTHDIYRNQMVRVIETALTFQAASPNGNQWPKYVHFCLLTPQCFKTQNCAGGGYRFYHYKFHEYKQSSNALQEEIEGAAVPKRNAGGWKYPKLVERLTTLSLHWVTYEDLLNSMPDSTYKRALLVFISQQPNCLLRIP